MPLPRILKLIERHCGFERCRERAVAFTGKARSIIAEFPESPYQRALCSITELMIPA